MRDKLFFNMGLELFSFQLSSMLKEGILNRREIDLGWLNIGSLVLGFIAWILPVLNLTSKEITPRWTLLAMGSLSACGTSILLQLYYQAYLVEIMDWSALLDTIPTVVSVAAFLLISTILLNGIAYFKSVFQQKHRQIN